MLLLPGHRIRHPEKIENIRRRRAGRAQDLPRPDAGRDAVGALAGAPAVRQGGGEFSRARRRRHGGLRERAERPQPIPAGGEMNRLKDRTAIVTGAGSGFGAGIARRFAEEGARVIVNDINAAGEKIASEVRGRFVQADVTQAAGWQRLVREAGPELSIVVNNAGWTHRRKPFSEMSEAEFDRVYAVNVKSIFLSALHVLPVFRQRGGGAFVNIASTAGVRPRPGLTVYNSSKGAVITMSKSMAAEFGPDKVRVNCVNPVFSPETSLSADFAGGTLSEEAKKSFLATIPLGRFSTPLDVANACLYLASDEASLVSGVCIEVDGARCV